MSALDIIQPLGIVLGVIVAVAIAYLAGTSLKARREERAGRRGKHSSQ